jgi:hypothetical protein
VSRDRDRTKPRGRIEIRVAKPRLVIAVGIAVVLLSLVPAFVKPSGASFTASSTSTVSGSADNINRYLHIYSRSTDPDGYTGYYNRRGTAPAQPAATGVDDTLAVNIGGTGRPANFTAAYLFGLKIAPGPLPRGLTQVTLTVTAGPDLATGMQPLVMTGSNTVTGAANAKYYFSVDVNVTNAFAQNTLYTPHLYVTVTYTGFTTLTYYQYDIPVKVYTGAGAGPNSAQTTSSPSSARGLTKAVDGVPVGASKATATPAPKGTSSAKPTPTPTPTPTPKPRPTPKQT